MKKIFSLSFLLLALAGCSTHAEEVGVNEYMPTRSRVHVPAEPQAPKAPRQAPANRRQPDNQNTINSLPTLPKSDHIAHHQTTFDTSDKGRETNITLATNAINGTIVKPGETFSFNTTIGSTTEERGYKKAVIFIDGEKSENFGGGVCQVSTTLCNAAINAGLTIIERHDHSLPVKYAEEGKEAATSHNGKLDFKFKNEKQHAVIIDSKTENGTISVTIKSV